MIIIVQIIFLGIITIVNFLEGQRWNFFVAGFFFALILDIIADYLMRG